MDPSWEPLVLSLTAELHLFHPLLITLPENPSFYTFSSSSPNALFSTLWFLHLSSLVHPLIISNLPTSIYLWFLLCTHTSHRLAAVCYIPDPHLVPPTDIHHWPCLLHPCSPHIAFASIFITAHLLLVSPTSMNLPFHTASLMSKLRLGIHLFTTNHF